MSVLAATPPDATDPGGLVWLAVAAPAWVGHAYWLTGFLNHLYGRPISKLVLRAVRALTGLLILAFPALVWLAVRDPGLSGLPARAYLAGCAGVGGLWFPAVTAYRYFRPRPRCILSETSELVDYAPTVGPAACAGDGKWAFLLRRAPLVHDAYKVEYTELELAVPALPPAWDGLTILLLSDLHFCGTPGRAWYDAVFDRVAAGPVPDLVVLAGDFVDTDRHRDWIGPLLGRLRWKEHGLAILGNHDVKHDPEALREDLTAAGYDVLGNHWKELSVRGERVVAVGHEGPWITPPPDLTGAPEGVFRLCLSHTPDNFPWGVTAGLNLMLCGHVHGGQIRVPVVGSIFVPSVYGRRFDMGVFERPGTVMVVGRGLSGKEPFRFRCPPQVLRLTLRPAGTEPASRGGRP